MKINNNEVKIITYLKGYFTSKNYIEEFLVKVFDYKIKVKSISYFGYLQGHKVFINGKKYPLEYGHHYTSNTIKQAVISAFNDKEL
tara:strand:- start:245 stop:502 length:258 start_codon:yes stop_codon:yes gene_type:complete